MEISIVPPEHLHTVWDIVAPLLQRGLEYTHGRVSLPALHKWLISGEETLWIAIEDEVVIGCFTVRIIDYPEKRSISIETLGGVEAESWLTESFYIIEQYGKEFDCEVFEFNGRPGWEPFAKRRGFEKYAIKMQRDIGE